MRSRLRCLVLGLACAGLLLLPAATTALAATTAVAAAAADPVKPGGIGVATATIPRVVGLTTVGATSEARGDYETLRVVDRLSAAGHRIVVSGEVPNDNGQGVGEFSVVRMVRAGDQLRSRRMRNYFHTGDAEVFGDTVPDFSAATLNALRASGRAPLTYVEARGLFGMSVVLRELSGEIVRVGSGRSKLTLPVNGRQVALPVIHARGQLDGEAFEFHVLDDPANPILLRTRGPGFRSAVVRIEYPERKAAAMLERKLEARQPAQVYGIYFSFARADIRPQSQRVLHEIADVLRRNPDWALRIDGHTDGIGDAAANMALSQRRAAAVKVALVRDFAIAGERLTTGGAGESRPQASNDTAQGRARNRRVELTRQ